MDYQVREAWHFAADEMLPPHGRHSRARARPTTKWRHAEFSVSVFSGPPDVVITDDKAALPDGRGGWNEDRQGLIAAGELLEAETRSCPARNSADGIPQ